MAQHNIHDDDEDGGCHDMEAIIESRRWWHRKAMDAAARGNPLAGMLAALEHQAEPFFLGMDEDEDISDFDDMEAL